MSSALTVLLFYDIRPPPSEMCHAFHKSWHDSFNLYSIAQLWQRGRRKKNLLPLSSKTRVFCFGCVDAEHKTRFLFGNVPVCFGCWSGTMSFSTLNTLKSLPRQYCADSVRHNSNNPSTNPVNVHIISFKFERYETFLTYTLFYILLP